MAAHGRWFPARIRVIALLAAAVAGLSGIAMASSASAQPSPVQHVVLYLENHSFDSLLGYWCNDHPGRCPDGGMPAQVTLSNGTVVTPTVSPDIVPSVSHSVQSRDAAIDGGRMDGWQQVQGCQANPLVYLAAALVAGTLPVLLARTAGLVPAPRPWPEARCCRIRWAMAVL